MNPFSFDILTDEELQALLHQNPKAALAYTSMLNAMVRQTQTAAQAPAGIAAPLSPTPQSAQAPPPTPPAPAKADPFPSLEDCTRIEVTIWDNVDEHGNRPKGQTRYKAEIKGWTVDCTGIRAPRHQWRRNLSLYEKWPFTAKFEKLTITPEYVGLLNFIVDCGTQDTFYAMFGDKSGGTNYYDRQTIMFDMKGAQVSRGLLVIGEDAVRLDNWTRTQAGAEAKPLSDKIVAQCRWSKNECGWATDVAEVQLLKI
jgi:hypothetical protein